MRADAPALDKQAVARRFNRSAGTYDQACRVQRRMADRLARTLAAGPAPRRILELGCGTGYLTGLLAAGFPHAEILAVDFAGRMVEVARARLASPRLQFLVADAETAELGGPFDAVVSNAAVQWFTEPEMSLPKLAGNLSPGGRMLHATFGPETLAELRSCLHGEDGREPPATPLRPGAGWESILAGSGLVDLRCESRLETELYPSASDLLRELHATGVTSRPAGDPPPLAPRRLLGGLRRYEQRFRAGEGVPATWQTLELSGVRPA